jgi:hypothetical protein
MELRPAEISRQKWLTRYEAWSPKLGRRLTLFSSRHMALWAVLEGTPSVKRFCEYPGELQWDDNLQLVHFWVQRDHAYECLILPTHPPLRPSQGTIFARLPMSWTKFVRFVGPQELDQQRTFIDNWLVILPYLAANRRLLDPHQFDRILAHAEKPQWLTTFEQAEIPTDPVLTRTAVFELIRRGSLIADELHHKPLGPRLRIARAEAPA